MAPSSPFQDTEKTRAALMKATYDALCKHGYAGLTIQRIGDEFPKSKSLIYQHYDGKDELLVTFLDFMSEHFENEVSVDDSENASDRLQAPLDHLLAPTFDEHRHEFMSAMIELRAQAPHNEAYRERFTKSDQILHTHLTAVLRTGIEQGEFQAVDPEQTAGLLLTVLDGAIFRRMTTDDSPDIQAIRAELDEYIRLRLLIGDNESE